MMQFLMIILDSCIIFLPFSYYGGLIVDSLVEKLDLFGSFDEYSIRTKQWLDIFISELQTIIIAVAIPGDCFRLR